MEISKFLQPPASQQKFYKFNYDFQEFFGWLFKQIHYVSLRDYIKKMLAAMGKPSAFYFQQLIFWSLTNQYNLSYQSSSAMQAGFSNTVDQQILESFQLMKKVGQGAYGHVWKARFKQGSRICALKKIQNAFSNATDAQKVYREIKYLQKLNHPNIVKMLNYQLLQNSLDIYIALQFVAADLTLAIRNGVLKQIHKDYIFYQIANGVHYLHSAQLIHRDLKPSNILVSQSCQVKICDFGLIRSLVPEQTSKQLCLTEKIATRWYRPPQILICSNNYGKEVDIWSLGCILAEIYLGRPLFQGSSAISQLQKIFEVIGKPSREELSFVKSEASKSIVQSMTTTKIKSFKDLFQNQDKLLIDLLQQIFKIVPKKRPTIQQILSHPFLSKFKGKIQLIKSAEAIRIKNQSKKLTIQEYKHLLLKQPHKKIYQQPKTGKRSQPSTYYQSSVTHSLQNNSRHHYFKSMSPLGRFSKQSPERQYQNKLGAKCLVANVENKLGKNEIFKTIKSNYQEKKELLRQKHQLQKKYNIQLQNNSWAPRSNWIRSPSKLDQNKEKYSSYLKTGFLRSFSPMKIFDDLPKMQTSNQKIIKPNPESIRSPPRSLQKRIRSMKQMLKVFQSKSRSKSSKNSPNKKGVLKTVHEFSQPNINKTISNKQQNKRQHIVPKFILEGRKKFRSQSPPQQLKQVKPLLFFRPKHAEPKKEENPNHSLSHTMNSNSRVKVYNFRSNVGFPMQRTSYNFPRQPSAYLGS